MCEFVLIPLSGSEFLSRKNSDDSINHNMSVRVQSSFKSRGSICRKSSDGKNQHYSTTKSLEVRSIGYTVPH